MQSSSSHCSRRRSLLCSPPQQQQLLLLLACLMILQQLRWTPPTCSAAGLGLARGRRAADGADDEKYATVDPTTGEINVQAATTVPVNQDLVDRLIENSGADAFVLSESVAVDIAAVLEAAQSDPETSLLLLRLQKEGESDSNSHLRNLQRDLTPDMIVAGLAEAVAEMEMAEILFQDPHRALAEMEKDGMVPPERRAEYQKHPERLADDTRKRLYFTFVALAAAGGYL